MRPGEINLGLACELVFSRKIFLWQRQAAGDLSRLVHLSAAVKSWCKEKQITPVGQCWTQHHPAHVSISNKTQSPSMPTYVLHHHACMLTWHGNKWITIIFLPVCGCHLSSPIEIEEQEQWSTLHPYANIQAMIVRAIKRYARPPRIEYL